MALVKHIDDISKQDEVHIDEGAFETTADFKHLMDLYNEMVSNFEPSKFYTPNKQSKLSIRDLYEISGSDFKSSDDFLTDLWD